MKRIIDQIALIPNIPLMMILSLLILYQMIREIGITEFYLSETENISKEIVGKIQEVYPKSLVYLIAVIVYTLIIMLVLNLTK